MVNAREKSSQTKYAHEGGRTYGTTTRSPPHRRFIAGRWNNPHRSRSGYVLASLENLSPYRGHDALQEENTGPLHMPTKPGFVPDRHETAKRVTDKFTKKAKPTTLRNQTAPFESQCSPEMGATTNHHERQPLVVFRFSETTAPFSPEVQNSPASSLQLQQLLTPYDSVVVSCCRHRVRMSPAAMSSAVSGWCPLALNTPGDPPAPAPLKPLALLDCEKKKKRKRRDGANQESRLASGQTGS